MVIPLEVHYTMVGKRKTCNVVGAIFPTALAQEISRKKLRPIQVNMGDAAVDWNATSPGYERFTERDRG